jgi:hypothetical protein
MAVMEITAEKSWLGWVVVVNRLTKHYKSD